MKIYEALKNVLSKEQLEDFQEEVKKTIEEAVEKRQNELTKISESYVKESAAEKAEEIEAQLKEKFEGEYGEKVKELEAEKASLNEARTALETEYAEKEAQLVDLYEEKNRKLEEEYKGKVVELTEEHKAEIERQLEEEGVVTREKFETFRQMFEEKEEQMVEALNKFLNEQIAEKISDRLIRESVASEELVSLVEGIKMLYEEHYSGIDETAGIRKIREENKELKEAYERLFSEKADLSQKLEEAATRLLITEKTRDLSDDQAEKVTTYFEGRDFDFVKDRIDNFVTLTENEQQNRKALRSERRIQRLDEVNSGCLPEKRPATRESDILSAASKYM